MILGSYALDLFYRRIQRRQIHMFDKFPHPILRDSTSTEDLNCITRRILATGRGVAFQESNLSAKIHPVNKWWRKNVGKWLPSEFASLLFVRLSTLG